MTAPGERPLWNFLSSADLLRVEECCVQNYPTDREENNL